MSHHQHHHRLRLLILFLLQILPSLSRADDGAVVLSLAKSIRPLPSGWSTKSSSGFCDWPSIQCDRAGTVTSISLARRGLSGTLPPELATLSNLENFAVQNNDLNGAIPPFANLSSLQTLYLDSNNFNSIGPGFLQGLTGLRSLTMGNNGNLAPWVLPTYLSDSTDLGNLTANNCSLVGIIPEIFGPLVSLQNLRLSYNNLTGGLPPSMAKSMIQNLWLNNQDVGLTGPIDVLSSMTSLSLVWLHKNAITGPIPDLSQCKKLTDLQLRDNQLTGIVPKSVLALPMLQNVSLGNNRLQGPYPAFSPGVNVDDHGTNSYCAAQRVPCDPQVMVMLEIAKGFGYPSILADAWQGNNACVDWSSVICDNQKKNVISVNLQNKGLLGTISPAFANLTSLSSLYLNNNTLKGPIPDSLTGLTTLKLLDVSNNNLSGQIPKFSTSVKLVTQPGNPFLGKDIKDNGTTPGPSGGGTGTGTGTGTGGNDTTTPAGSTNGTKKKKLSVGIIVVIVVASVIVLCVLSFLLWKYVRNQGKYGRKESVVYGKQLVKKAGSLGGENGYNKCSPQETHHGTSSGDNGGVMFEVGNVTVSIEVLREVTNNFSEDNILGRGGFGVVYAGELHDGTKIAVKRMESGLIGTKGLNEFQAEIAVLSKVRHRHLVGLHGYCVNGNERLLVYEYMPQGTLAQHIFDRQDSQYSALTWKQRVIIALDVARAVEYMHNLAQQSFIHRDLKPSNILLGDDMRAKVSDFGLVKNAPDGKYSVETRLAGTFGYLAPEYAATGRVTTKVDVFAFGVIVMEMITGRKALDDSLPDEMSHLVTWFRRVLINKEQLRKAIDETLDSDEETLESIYKLAELAGHCTAAEPSQRPDMGHAVNVLAPLVEQWTPSGHHEDRFGVNLHMSLSEAVQRWKASEDSSSSMTFNDSSFSRTQSSIPSKPYGIKYTFNSSDAR